ncbi:unnamed protein product [Schistocephalus solidus]|uniref:DUF4206 domain-containing protein n=1 Tax=Schistocephalus solidus TaxID=70667 RepID=A0A183TFQ4_SCHSO|nr:unnamed protein product [Schistocephalus solidus]
MYCKQFTSTSTEKYFKVSAAQVQNISSTWQIAIQTRAVRKRLRKYLSLLEQSHFDLANPRFALNNPITVFIDESWADKKLAIEELLFRSTDSETELALWNRGPTHGERIKSFLNEFVRTPLVNVVTVNFSPHLLSTVDFFTYFGSHHLPELRSLNLSLYHAPDLLRTVNVEMEVDCFPSLKEARIFFAGSYCYSCFCAVLYYLRNTAQLTLLGCALSMCVTSCCPRENNFSFLNLRKLRTSIRLLLPEEWHQGIQFPRLERLVLHCSMVSDYQQNKWKYKSLFPGAQIHFYLPKPYGDTDLNDWESRYLQNRVDMTLTLADTDGPSSRVRFVSCSEFYLTDDRIFPLSLKEVHLQFYPEQSISRRSKAFESSYIEDMILRADGAISHLRCSSISVEERRTTTLFQDFVTVARLKFLPFLTAQRHTLVSLDLSADLLHDCLNDQQALNQILSLRGQLKSVRELVANSASVLRSRPFIIAILSWAVRKRLRKHLSRLDQSKFDLAFPAFALNNPINVFLDDNWILEKQRLERLLVRRNGFVTQLALWDGGPMCGEGIKGFLDYFHKRPFVNLVAIDFTAQCLSVADFFIYFGDHQMPQLRRLSLSLYHVPGLLVPAGVDMEAGYFMSLDDANIRFTEHWCHSCYFAVLHHLRNTSHLALLDDHLFVEKNSCLLKHSHVSFPNLRQLRLSLKSFLLSEEHMVHHFPALEIVFLEWFQLDGYLRNLANCNSLFPTARVHFSVHKDCRVFGWHRCGACTLQPSARNELAFASSPDYTTGTAEPVVNFCGCSELYLSDDRIFPLSLKEVYLQFYLEPIIRRSDLPLRRSAIEEVLLKADCGVSHLQCLLCSVSDYALETLTQGVGTAARLKFLPLLAAHRYTLTSLEISADLVFGCLTDQHALQRVVSLRGQLPTLRVLVISSETGLGIYLLDIIRISGAELKPFLEMFPCITEVEVQRANHIRRTKLGDICAVCPRLQILRCYLCGYGQDCATEPNPPYRLDTLHWSLDGDFTADHLNTLPDGRPIELVSADSPRDGDLVPLCPQLFSKIWSSIMRVNYFHD